MLVTFHGVRGSTPCHGDDIARYGGNTSCVSVRADGERPLLFDLGTGLRYFANGLPVDEPFDGTALVSHLHWDHVQGLPFFSPLQHPDARLVVYAPPQDGERNAADYLTSSICPPMFPVGLDCFPGTIDIRDATPSFGVGGFDVRTVPVPHVGCSLGYRVDHGGRSVGYVSDHQQPLDGARIAPGVHELLDGVDLLIHDAQYTPAEFAGKRDWGHCTVEYAVWLAARVGAARLALYHHDPSHDDDMLDRLAAMATECGRGLGVDVFAAYEGLTVDLSSP